MAHRNSLERLQSEFLEIVSKFDNPSQNVRKNLFAGMQTNNRPIRKSVIDRATALIINEVNKVVSSTPMPSKVQKQNFTPDSSRTVSPIESTETDNKKERAQNTISYVKIGPDIMVDNNHKSVSKAVVNNIEQEDDIISISSNDDHTIGRNLRSIKIENQTPNRDLENATCLSTTSSKSQYLASVVNRIATRCASVAVQTSRKSLEAAGGRNRMKGRSAAKKLARNIFTNRSAAKTQTSPHSEPSDAVPEASDNSSELSLILDNTDAVAPTLQMAAVKCAVVGDEAFGMPWRCKYGIEPLISTDRTAVAMDSYDRTPDDETFLPRAPKRKKVFVNKKKKRGDDEKFVLISNVLVKEGTSVEEKSLYSRTKQKTGNTRRLGRSKKSKTPVSRRISSDEGTQQNQMVKEQRNDVIIEFERVARTNIEEIKTRSKRNESTLTSGARRDEYMDNVGEGDSELEQMTDETDSEQVEKQRVKCTKSPKNQKGLDKTKMNQQQTNEVGVQRTWSSAKCNILKENNNLDETKTNQVEKPLTWSRSWTKHKQLGETSAVRTETRTKSPVKQTKLDVTSQTTPEVDSKMKQSALSSGRQENHNPDVVDGITFECIKSPEQKASRKYKQLNETREVRKRTKTKSPVKQTRLNESESKHLTDDDVFDRITYQLEQQKMPSTSSTKRQLLDKTITAEVNKRTRIKSPVRQHLFDEAETTQRTPETGNRKKRSSDRQSNRNPEIVDDVVDEITSECIKSPGNHLDETKATREAERQETRSRSSRQYKQLNETPEVRRRTKTKSPVKQRRLNESESKHLTDDDVFDGITYQLEQQKMPCTSSTKRQILDKTITPEVNKRTRIKSSVRQHLVDEAETTQRTPETGNRKKRSSDGQSHLNPEIVDDVVDGIASEYIKSPGNHLDETKAAREAERQETRSRSSRQYKQLNETPEVRRRTKTKSPVKQKRVNESEPTQRTPEAAKTNKLTCEVEQQKAPSTSSTKYQLLHKTITPEVNKRTSVQQNLLDEAEMTQRTPETGNRKTKPSEDSRMMRSKSRAKQNVLDLNQVTPETITKSKQKETTSSRSVDEERCGIEEVPFTGETQIEFKKPKAVGKRKQKTEAHVTPQIPGETTKGPDKRKLGNKKMTNGGRRESVTDDHSNIDSGLTNGLRRSSRTRNAPPSRGVGFILVTSPSTWAEIEKSFGTTGKHKRKKSSISKRSVNSTKIGGSTVADQAFSPIREEVDEPAEQRKQQDETSNFTRKKVSSFVGKISKKHSPKMTNMKKTLGVLSNSLYNSEEIALPSGSDRANSEETGYGSCSNRESICVEGPDGTNINNMSKLFKDGPVYKSDGNLDIAPMLSNRLVGYASGSLRIQPGCSKPRQRTNNSVLFLVIEGTGLFEIDGQTRQLQVGGQCAAYKGSQYSIKNMNELHPLVLYFTRPSPH